MGTNHHSCVRLTFHIRVNVTILYKKVERQLVDAMETTRNFDTAPANIVSRKRDKGVVDERPEFI